MEKKTVAVLTTITIISWAAVKWLFDQLAGNFLYDWLLKNVQLPAMTATAVLNLLLLALVLAGVLAAYVLGTSNSSRRPVGATGSIGASAETAKTEDYAHGLHADGPTLDLDVVSAKKRNIQLGVTLRNSTHHVMQYTIDEMRVTLNNRVLPNPAFSNSGGILRPGQFERFRYDVFRNVVLPDSAPATVEIVARYGPPGLPPVRRLSQAFNCTVRANASPASVTWARSGLPVDQAI